MKKLIIVLAVLLVIVIAVTTLFSVGTSLKNKKSPLENGPTVTLAPAVPQTRTFVIYAKNWDFNPNVIRLKKGDHVIFQIKSIDVKHGFSQPEYQLQATLEPFKFVTLEFIANKSGKFVYTCTLNCGPAGYSGMKGLIIVE